MDFGLEAKITCNSEGYIKPRSVKYRESSSEEVYNAYGLTYKAKKNENQVLFKYHSTVDSGYKTCVCQAVRPDIKAGATYKRLAS